MRRLVPLLRRGCDHSASYPGLASMPRNVVTSMTDSMSSRPRLRVAFVAGTLDRGGAEKQLFYMARALAREAVDVRVYSLRRGEFFEAELQRVGIPPVWIGRRAHPVARTIALVRALVTFRPHIVQSAHFYANLYAVAAAMAYRALGIGALRSDAYYEVSANGRWGRWLLREPTAILANSRAAKRNAESFGVRPGTVHVVPNVIDLAEFDRSAGNAPARESGRIVVASVATQVPVKRLERFIAALACARKVGAPRVCGLLIGTGPEHEHLRAVAHRLGLGPSSVAFLGPRDDVPRLLRSADLLLVTSDDEGFPNMILEAMAAGLPVITTPAGDAGVIVEDGVTGYVVPFDGVDQMAERIIRLARSPSLRQQLGLEGRHRAEQRYGFEGLARALLDAYREIAECGGQQALLKCIPR